MSRGFDHAVYVEAVNGDSVAYLHALASKQSSEAVKDATTVHDKHVIFISYSVNLSLCQ